MQPNPPNNANLMAAAEQIDSELHLLTVNELAMTQLLERLQALEKRYHELAQLWDKAGNSVRAAQARSELERILGLIERVSQLATVNADEAGQFETEIADLLREIGKRR